MKVSHGNIKHSTCFYHDSYFYLEDCVTVIPLYEEENYQVNWYTAGFASPQFIKKVKNRQTFSKDELLREDYHQFKQTIRYLLRGRRENMTPLVEIIRKTTEKASYIEELWNLLAKDFDFLVLVTQSLRQFNAPFFAKNLWTQLIRRIFDLETMRGLDKRIVNLALYDLWGYSEWIEAFKRGLNDEFIQLQKPGLQAIVQIREALNDT